MLDKRPIIGITMSEAEPDDTFGMAAYSVQASLCHAVYMTGGLPFPIPLLQQGLTDVAASLDGLILSGGTDAFPEHFYAADKQAGLYTSVVKFECTQELIRCAFSMEIPLLGVCAGMQAMAGYHGGRLERCPVLERPMVNHWQIKKGKPSHHMVKIAPGSRLAGIIESEETTVNSMHRERVVNVGQTAKVSATATDGTIEALELDAEALAIGVQWHPELEPKAAAGWPIIKAIVDAARRRS